MLSTLTDIRYMPLICTWQNCWKWHNQPCTVTKHLHYIQQIHELVSMQQSCGFSLGEACQSSILARPANIHIQCRHI
jgi:hypothetical protein